MMMSYTMHALFMRNQFCYIYLYSHVDADHDVVMHIASL